MYCGKCGKEIRDDASFCPNCGAATVHKTDAAESDHSDEALNREDDNVKSMDNNSEPDNKGCGPEKNTKSKNKKLLWITAAVIAVAVIGGGGYVAWDNHQKQVAIAEQKAREKKEAEEKAAKQEEEWQSAKKDWESMKNSKTLKALLTFKDMHPEAEEMGISWYESLWEDPMVHLDQIAESMDLLNKDQDLKPTIDILQKIVTSHGSNITYENDVHFDYTDTGINPDLGKAIICSSVSMEPVLTRDGLSFTVTSGYTPYPGLGMQMDPDFDSKKEGIFGIRLQEETYPASIKDGKLAIQALYGSPQSADPKDRNKPIDFVFDQDTMTITDGAQNNGLMYRANNPEFINRSTVSRFVNQHPEIRTGSEGKSVEYFSGDLNGDGLEDIIIRDSYSTDDKKAHPANTFYLAQSDGTFVNSGEDREWDNCLIYDGKNLLRYGYRQDMYMLEKFIFSGDSFTTEIIERGKWDGPGAPDFGDPLVWTMYSYK